jgi:hypothetical protein
MAGAHWAGTVQNPAGWNVLDSQVSSALLSDKNFFTKKRHKVEKIIVATIIVIATILVFR